MQIRKTTDVAVRIIQTDSVVQRKQDCNEQVQVLFDSKPDLRVVTLEFSEGSEIVRKRYERI